MDTIWAHSAKKFDFWLYKNADRMRFHEAGFRAPGNRTPLKIMKKNKINPIVLAAIILVGGFFAYKIIAFLGCTSTYAADDCFAIVFLK